jgi:chromosome segregation ATPase
MPPNKGVLRKIAAQGRAANAEKQTILSEESASMELKERLHIAVQHAQRLESDLLAVQLKCKSLDAELEKSKLDKSKLTADILHWKAKHKAVYHELRMTRQTSKRGLTKQGILESQIQILKDAAVNSRAQLAKHTKESQKAIASLMKVNENLHSELSESLATWKNQLDYVKSKLQKTSSTLKGTQKEITRLSKVCMRASGIKQHAVAATKNKVAQQMATHHLMWKGVFTEETRNVVHLLTKAGCSG